PPTSTLFPYTTLFRSNPSNFANIKPARRPEPKPPSLPQHRPAPRSGQRGGVSAPSPASSPSNESLSTSPQSSSRSSVSPLHPGRSEEHTSELQSRGHL